MFKDTINLTLYQEDALKTAFYPNMGNNIEYTVIALLEESIEVLEKIEFFETKEAIVKEIGDMLWYTAMIFYEFKKPFIFNKKQIYMTPLKFIIKTGKLASILKKTLRDDDQKFTIENEIEFFLIIDELLSFVTNIADQIGYTIEDICKMNIDKINDRIKRGKLNGSGDNR